MSFSSDIAAAVEGRLGTIRKSGGSATNVGAKVLRGKQAIDVESDLPCVVIIEGLDSVESDRQLHSVRVHQRYLLEAHAITADPDNPNDLAHLMLSDLKRAVFDRRMDLGLAGRVKVHYRGRAIGVREDGSNAVFASISIDVEYIENLLEP